MGAFDYPLPIPQKTLYSQLGIEPEAADDEIRAATGGTDSRLKDERAAAERALEEIYAAVPGLKDAHDLVRTLQGAGKEGADGLAEAQRKLADLERKAQSVNPDFRQLRERPAELSRKIEENNKLPLSSREGRNAYDQANPPLALFKLADCARDGFTANKVALTLVRREIAQFLTSRGEEIFHPSDLTREDFSADFYPNPILDGGHDERPRP